MDTGAAMHAMRVKYRELLEHAADAAKAWRKETGRPVVGYLGADVPTEIISAAGLLPVRIGVFEAAVDSVRRFQEIGDSHIVAQLANALIDGRYSFLDHVVIGNTPTFNITLFHFLRESRRLDASFPGPPMTFHEMHHGAGETIETFNLESCRRLALRMGEIGEHVSVPKLQTAIERRNDRRRHILELRALRRQDPAAISGTDALLQLVQCQVMPQDPRLDVASGTASQPRIMLSGSDIGHFLSYPLIEAAGCTIVADDHDWGEDALLPLIDTHGDPLGAIAARYTHRAPQAARWPRNVRLASLVERAVDARVDGVVFWISDEDQASSWDVPGLRAALRAKGVATLDLGPLPAFDIDAAAITTKLRSWLRDLPPREQTVTT